VEADSVVTAVDRTTWGTIKSLYRSSSSAK